MADLPPFSRKELLQCDSSQLYNMLSRLAMQFAVLGYSDVTLRLVSKMNRYDYFHGQHVVLRPLYLLWDTLGSWPDLEEERPRENIAKDRQRLAKRNDDEVGNERAGKQAKVETRDSPVTRGDVQAELEKLANGWAQSWYSPDRERTGVGWGNVQKKTEQSASNKSPAQAIKEILVAIEEMHPKEHRNSQTGWLAMKASSGLVNALDLRLQLVESGHETEGKEDVPDVDELLGMIAKRLNANQQVQNLSQSPRIWKMLSGGALARVLGIESEKVDAFAKAVEETVDERFKNGRVDYPELPIKDILKQMEQNTREDPEAYEDERGGNLGKDDTLFRDAATAQDIAKTEKRLSITLPDDYKEFVLTTNGFGAAFGGIINEPPLHPLSELRCFGDDEDYFTELCLDIPGNKIISIVQAWDADGNADWVKVGKAIEIGTEDIDNLWLLSPTKMDEVKDRVRDVLNSDKYDERIKTSVRHMMESFAGSEEKFWSLGWGCVTWASGGSACMTAHPTFKAYLQSVMHGGMKENKSLLSEGKFFGYAMLKESAL
jgi:hypothetical protein